MHSLESDLRRAPRQGAELAPWRRRGRAMAGLVLGVVTSANTACYTYVPLQGRTLQPGDRVGLLVNDEGRVALHEQVGSGVDRIEGTLVAARGEEYHLRVSRVRTIRGEASHWSGEQIRVPLAAVVRVDGRYLSRQKTTLAVVGTVAAVTLLLLASSLAGFGFDSDRPPEGPPGGGSDQ